MLGAVQLEFVLQEEATAQRSVSDESLKAALDIVGRSAVGG